MADVICAHLPTTDPYPRVILSLSPRSEIKSQKEALMTSRAEIEAQVRK